MEECADHVWKTVLQSGQTNIKRNYWSVRSGRRWLNEH
jgi:hypothetical protein